MACLFFPLSQLFFRSRRLRCILAEKYHSLDPPTPNVECRPLVSALPNLRCPQHILPLKPFQYVALRWLYSSFSTCLIPNVGPAALPSDGAVALLSTCITRVITLSRLTAAELLPVVGIFTSRIRIRYFPTWWIRRSVNRK